MNGQLSTQRSGVIRYLGGPRARITCKASVYLQDLARFKMTALTSHVPHVFSPLYA